MRRAAQFEFVGLVTAAGQMLALRGAESEGPVQRDRFLQDRCRLQHHAPESPGTRAFDQFPQQFPSEAVAAGRLLMEPNAARSRQGRALE